MHGESALVNIRHAVILVRAAMSLCRCLRMAVAHVDGQAAPEMALANVGSAAESAGFFTAAVDYEREEREREREALGGGGWGEVEELVNFTPESDLPADLAEVSETLLGEQTGMWPAFVGVSQAQARGVLHVLMEQLVEHMEAISDAFEAAPPPAALGAAGPPGAPIAVLPPVPGAAAPGAPITVPPPVARGTPAAADGTVAEGAAVQELTSAGGESGGPVGEGASTEGASQQLPESGGGSGEDDEQLGSTSPTLTHTPLKGRTTPSESIPSKKTAPPNKRTLAIPVEVFCPPLESLTLESIQFASTCDPSWLPYLLPSASPLMCPFSHTTTPHASLPSSSSSPNPVPSVSSKPQSFKALARAAMCGRLKSLTLVNCTGLGERQLVRLLRACGMLEDLRVEGSDGFSDTVIARSQLEVLTRLTVVGCGGVTAHGIGGLLGNVPRLRYLKVEASKTWRNVGEGAIGGESEMAERHEGKRKGGRECKQR
ncbi:unnamed protein product [Closterium sp. NIES-65]|nr:unnamed protein product [Closterium sp. NIES-65]